MRVPAIQGVIVRRVLVNFRVRPESLATILPPVFRPQLVNGWAIAGICLIRLEKIRPRWAPPLCGISSENAAHRIAVEWTAVGTARRGVFIPRRDTSSWLNAFAGGRVFPGEHHRARFKVEDARERISIEYASVDGSASVELLAHEASLVPSGSVFSNLNEASEFFRAGATGYSARDSGTVLDGLELRCRTWNMRPLAVERVRSTYFEDPARFAPGAAEFDSAFIMRRVEHEWVEQGEMCCDVATHPLTV